MLSSEQIEALRKAQIPGAVGVYSRSWTAALNISWVNDMFKIQDPGGYVTATKDIAVVKDLIQLEAHGIGCVRELVFGEIPKIWKESHELSLGSTDLDPDLDLDLDYLDLEF